MNIINLHDKNLYYIGGAVRDKILGIENFDVDITYVGNAVEFAKTIPDAKIIQINEDFGTVRINLEGKEIDIASTRNETYPQKGHLPVVKNIGCTLKEDVLRRDFTINALAQSTLTGEITDYTNGLADIKNKTLRVLHDKSFIDDPTRIIRCLKFSIRFGFEPDEYTKKLQDDYLDNVNYDMSYKRLKKELIEIFNLNSQKGFEKFVVQKMYKLITPCEFTLPNVNFEELINRFHPKNIWIIYAGILPDIGKLPLTKSEKKIVEDFYSLQKKSFSNDFEIYKNFDGVNIESIIMFTTFKKDISFHYLNNLRNIKLKITGNDLRNLGIKPSKQYQKCFDYILQEKINNNPSMETATEIKLAKEFFSII